MVAQDRVRELTTNRRAMLTGTATALFGGAGLTAAAGSATADADDVETIEISTDRFGRWTADGSLPVTDELFVFVHGWFGDTTVAEQAASVLESVRNAGYDPDAAVALEWPVATIGPEPDPESAGGVVADLLARFYATGGGSVRLVGHSLGCRAVLWALTALRWPYEVDTVALLGAAADGSEVCAEPFAEGLENACEVRNYHSENDETVGNAYGGVEGNALGADGASCDPGSNYADVDVTDSVEAHLEFLGDDEVGADLAAAIDGESDPDPWWPF